MLQRFGTVLCEGMQWINRIFHIQLFLLHISSDIRISVTQFNYLVFVRRAGPCVTDHIYSAVNDDVLRENPPTARLFKVRHIGWLGQS